jgi:Family of unknown function (DUF6788)
MSRQILLRKLLRAAGRMIQGGLSETTRRCGNTACACHRDPARRHGPHLYITYQSEGKNRALYVPARYAQRARVAQQAWREFWETGCALAALNREQLRQQWARERGAKAGGRRGRDSTSL